LNIGGRVEKPANESVILAARFGQNHVYLHGTPAAAWWQFVMNGPNGERQIFPHFETEKECKSVLKITEAELAKKYPDRYPLVGSCEQYR
jgi:hypothetical protein